MSSATDTCPGCGRTFAPGGYANHLRLSQDPRCGSLRDGLVYRYTSSLVNPPIGLQPTPQSTIPDVTMLDVSNEEPPPHSNPFPSTSQAVNDMSMDDDNGGDGNTESTGSTTDSEDDENRRLEDGAGDINLSLRTIFHRPSELVIATTDSDTDSETSDEEEERLQLQPTPLLSNPENPRCPLPPSTQTGRSFGSMINSLLTNSGTQNSVADNPVTVKFGGQAGEALPVPLKHVGYMGYRHVLGAEDDTPNEWAPFSSRMEWELARWAKLRGPSSTAMSELLKIDGVGQPSLLDLIFSNPPLDCQKPWPFILEFRGTQPDHR